MSRYIDADKIKYTNFQYGIVPTSVLTNIAFKEDIDKLSTSDVAPVVHAHYKSLKATECCTLIRWGSWCTHCNEIVPYANFCNNCGAKMDEKEEVEDDV